uniref:ATP synthase subunit a n=2 Tax=Urechis TaxID=6430 RepID=Q5YA28_URECA|nr:ATP synthase F0 subunit 6 [Urechis unicinctus]YP_133782.1 ATP synthase F0 subunit 6 [Urechis caupo]AAT12191.1 ATP synthase subunit 6 [Urechis caupo]ABR12813.1 ATP synthase F0 subunit 6 [Urechis unicinctus]
MLPDIFSAFDPATSSLFQNLSSTAFWAFQLSILLVLQTSIWPTPIRQTSLMSYPIHIMHGQMSRTLGKNLKGMTTLVTALMTMIILTNLIGLLPYVFSTSSHLIFSVTIGLPLWLSLIMSGVTFNFKMFFAHFVPSSAPNALAPALVLIETLSCLMRPITLSFRLAANMSAGHIVLTLIGSYAMQAMFSSPSSTILLVFFQTLYIFFEWGICLIQAYIFCLLLSLYADEHPEEKWQAPKLAMPSFKK